LHDRRIPRAAREVQRRVLADARHRRDVRAGVDEHLGHRRVAALGREVERGHAVAFGCADVGALLEQRTHGIAIATHRRVGDRRQ
jgi:hypothetical protein